MIKKLKEAHLQFVNIDFDQEIYADLLLKCIKDDFDYTIEMYGTVVPKKMPRPEIIWD